MVMPSDEGVPSIDDQTGLPNRVSWEAILEMEEQRSRRHGGEHSLVLVQLAGPVDGGLMERTGAAIGATVRDVDVVAVVGRETFAVLALYCQDITALVWRLRRAFEAAGLPVVARFDARTAGADLRAKWMAMAGDHSLPATLRYVDFVAPARPSQN
jgi:hypothetical protein